MYIVKPLIAECKKCLQLIEINDIDLEMVASYERNMGAEIEYESELDFYCEKCCVEINMKISVWEYPVGAVNNVSITSDDMAVIKEPVFSCYDSVDFE